MEWGCADEPWALGRLYAVLKPIMWRNDKASVGDELQLPPRTLQVCKLPSQLLLGQQKPFYWCSAMPSCGPQPP